MSKSQHEVAIATEAVMNQIFNIRGYKVMLDFHLASLYQVENRVLKQAVKRKQQRFPEDFMFQLTKEEWRELITICDNLPEGVKYSPRWRESSSRALVINSEKVLSSYKNFQNIQHCLELEGSIYETSAQCRMDKTIMKFIIKISRSSLHNPFV